MPRTLNTSIATPARKMQYRLPTATSLRSLFMLSQRTEKEEDEYS